MFKFFKRRHNKPNKPQTKSQYNIDNYRQLQARQNTPPRYNEGGSR